MSLLASKKKLLMAQGSGISVSDVFGLFNYTGTGGARTVTPGPSGISTDGALAWTKHRSTTQHHRLVDTVRGATNELFSSSNSQASSDANGLTSFGTTTIGLGSSAGYNANAAGYLMTVFRRHVGFFDIVTWAGNGASTRAIAHGLGSLPGLILIKNISSTSTNWPVWHKDVGSANLLYLNLTSAASGSSGVLSGDPTDAEFFVGNASIVNASGSNYVAYVFAHDPDSVIQCGSYVGSGSSSGPVVSLGWQPQYLFIKRSDSIGPWYMLPSDGAGLGGSSDSALFANTNNSESSGTNLVDLVTGGFQLRSTDASLNASGGQYIFLAIKAP